MQLSNVVSSLAEQLELCDWNAVWKALTLPATLLQLKILAIVRLRNKQKKTDEIFSKQACIVQSLKLNSGPS